MARYIRDFQINSSPDAVFNNVHQYLVSEGYEYIQYDNENVFKKGKGIMTGPTFIKVSFQGNIARVEAWMKYALLPGVYVGEIGLTGMMGAAVKGPLKRRVAYVENTICGYGADPAGYQQHANQPTIHRPVAQQTVANNTPVVNQPVAQQPANDYQATTYCAPSNIIYCSKCGTMNEREMGVCVNCGNIFDIPEQETQPAPQQTVNDNAQPYAQPVAQAPQQTPMGQYISKKEFRANYAHGFNKDIRNVAILCYICAGLNALISLLFYPLGIIDSLILLGVTLGMHLGKSKGCAIALLVISCFEALVGLILSGTPSSALWVIAGIWAVVTFNKADKAYTAYMLNNNNSYPH